MCTKNLIDKIIREKKLRSTISYISTVRNENGETQFISHSNSLYTNGFENILKDLCLGLHLKTYTYNFFSKHD